MSAICEAPVSVIGLSLIRLNLASAGAYKHLAAYTPSVAEERCCVRIAAERWRQWSELRRHFGCEELPHAEAEVAENDVREYSQILSQGEWACAAVIEADLFLRDVYDEAIKSVNNSSVQNLLAAHRQRIDEQIEQLRHTHAAEIEAAI